MIAVIKPTDTFEQLITRLFMWEPEREVKTRYNKHDIQKCLLRVADEEVLVEMPCRLSNGALYSTNCFSLSSAAAEMSAAARANVRVEKPAWNILLSWREGQHVEDDDVLSVIDMILSNFGMQKHQYICGVFRTDRRLFARLIVNRVHPDTAKVVDIYHDRIALQRIISEYNESHIV